MDMHGKTWNSCICKLRKADSKHAYCDLQFLVDDKEITRKHVNLYELINYYPEGFPLPVEVVINHIDKNSVKGYVSEPKYRNTERAGASAARLRPHRPVRLRPQLRMFQPQPRLRVYPRLR